jgi:hypothetical protein
LATSLLSETLYLSAFCSVRRIDYVRRQTAFADVVKFFRKLQSSTDIDRNERVAFAIDSNMPENIGLFRGPNEQFGSVSYSIPLQDFRTRHTNLRLKSQ